MNGRTIIEPDSGQPADRSNNLTMPMADATTPPASRPPDRVPLSLPSDD